MVRGVDGGLVATGEWLVVAGFRVGAGDAQDGFAVADKAVEVDAFPADGAGDALAFVSGEFAWFKLDGDPLLGEESGVWHFAVGGHLLLVFVFDFGVELAGELLGGFAGGDADGAVSGEVDESGGHFAPVAELESALAEAASGNDADGVCGAAVDFDKGDEALAVFASGLVDAEAGAAEEGHADAEDLSGAEVAVCDFGFVEEHVEGFHGCSLGWIVGESK